MAKIIKMMDLLKKEGIELGKVYTDKTMPPFKVNEKTSYKPYKQIGTNKNDGYILHGKDIPVEEELSEMKVNKSKVDKTYKSVLNHMRKVIKKLNDDEMYEVTTQLKKWFNKNIM